MNIETSKIIQVFGTQENVAKFFDNLAQTEKLFLDESSAKGKKSITGFVRTESPNTIPNNNVFSIDCFLAVRKINTKIRKAKRTSDMRGIAKKIWDGIKAITKEA